MTSSTVTPDVSDSCGSYVHVHVLLFRHEISFCFFFIAKKKEKKFTYW